MLQLHFVAVPSVCYIDLHCRDGGVCKNKGYEGGDYCECPVTGDFCESKHCFRLERNNHYVHSTMACFPLTEEEKTTTIFADTKLGRDLCTFRNRSAMYICRILMD